MAHNEDQVRAKLRLAKRLTARGKSYRAVVEALGVSSATYSRWRNAYPQWFVARHEENGNAAPNGNGADHGAHLERENVALKLALADILLRERGILPPLSGDMTAH